MIWQIKYKNVSKRKKSFIDHVYIINYDVKDSYQSKGSTINGM